MRERRVARLAIVSVIPFWLQIGHRLRHIGLEAFLIGHWNGSRYKTTAYLRNDARTNMGIWLFFFLVRVHVCAKDLCQVSVSA